MINNGIGGSGGETAAASLKGTSPPGKPPSGRPAGSNPPSPSPSTPNTTRASTPSKSSSNEAIQSAAGGANTGANGGNSASGGANGGISGGRISGGRVSGGGGGAASGVELALSRGGLVAVLDLCVALYKFVNVELHSQGWYAVRVRVVPGPDIMCTAHTVVQSHHGGANPHHQAAAAAAAGTTSASSAADGGGGSADAAAVKKQGWVVEEGGSCFRSSVFRIRYCYEEVKMQTALLMRIFVSNLQTLSSMTLNLEFELMFQEANLDNPTSVPDEFHLRTVARETVTLFGVAGGLAEYYGCTFSDEHFGLCSTGLFAGMAGFATKDMLDSPAQRTVSSGWLCHLVGEGRRDVAQHYRPLTVSESGGGGGGGNSGSPAPVRLAATSIGSPTAASGGATVSRLISEQLDFGDQELRKKVIRLVHQVVEAPSVRQGVPLIPSESERLDRLAAAYEVLAEGHKRSRDHLANFLRHAPPECFAPQNLDVLRALLASQTAAASPGGSAAASPATPPAAAAAAARTTSPSPLRGTRASPLNRLSLGGAAGAVAAAGGGAAAATAADGTPVAVPSLADFRDQLRHLPTTAAALQLMDTLLVALSRDSQTDWAVLGWVTRMVPRELMRHLKLHWERDQPDAVLPFIVWDSAPARDVIAAKAAAHRQDLRIPRFPMPAVQPGSLWGSPGDQPVLVVDDTQGVKWLAESETYFGPDFRPREEAHVAIFVHGFQGASTDLCLVKAHLMLMYPYLECFSSKTNEGNTHDALQDMGKRLAVEMAEVLAPFRRSTRRPLRKITLVGHSIGNLILRAALTQPEFEPYKHLLWLYISVCGPHLGFLYGTNAVVDTGLLLLKSIGKGKCLHQLTFSDAPQLTDCYLYRLAHECPLSVFKLVVVVSSPQDRYVPYHSSSITTCPQAERDSRRGRCYSEMLRALLSGVGQGTHFFRLAVDFSLRTKSFSFSKLVGRTAHIEFIESQLYVGLLLWGLVHRYTMLAPSPHSWL